MAGEISSFAALTGANTDPAADLLEIVDMSEAGATRNKKQTIVELRRALLTPRGALVTMAGNWTGQNLTAGVAVPWDTEVYDTDTCHDNATNNTRLAVPSGWSRVRLSGMLRTANGTVNDWFGAFVRKTGTDTAYPGMARQMVSANNTSVYVNFRSGVLTVTGGTDYFEVMAQVQADTSVDIFSY
jgi:hypothetical protein